MSTQYKGKYAEKKACEYLSSQGFKIIEQNFFAKKIGEIDIIASKNKTYHFIEVKSGLEYETAINNITPSKLSKIKRSIDYYLQTKKLDVDFCIDAIIVVDEELEFLENITL
ncbi:MAG: YraN family protein [Arcobacter sp.]|uniref:YraN family protein n=1 Tax=uncultured Arcobacter sp. TaxID=165434 RepID=UPI000CAE576F|nr:YraN family protein [uncultured Arcobacter sp.]PLY08607.1 MAG: YraN family protein [Arcobacter sp.]